MVALIRCPDFLIGIRQITCLALWVYFAMDTTLAYITHSFICYIGIAYQLPGEFADERAGLLTSHMKAMGLADSPRIM
jgi:hypothetical protein